jgi:arsenate reductase
VKVYAYANCGTCRKALKLAAELGVKAEVLPIREQPPANQELRHALSTCGGQVRRLFNTSGVSYREGKYSERLPGMTIDEALSQLSHDGNLVKRPLAFLPDGRVLIGFDEAEWRAALS